MSPIDHDTLQTIITDALERTAFVIVDPCDEESARSLAPATHHARIRYSGPASGEVFLSASAGFLIELASSILGVEPSQVRLDVEGCDALRELANIIGGSALVAIGGEDTPYSLGLPEIVPAAPSNPPHASCVVESMGETLLVQWHTNAARAAA
ncbi:MAG: chemotaxis protein CheX [Phycisphaerales bacterium]|nr:chemotaxis protein CheX [Phycisphaerales bacterium]